MSEEALQIAMKRRETKGKGEKERYVHLNEEFQRTAKRDKKAFLKNQCKEIEENNRMGKTRDVFKKIRDTREHFIKRWARYGPNRSRQYQEGVARIHRRTTKKKKEKRKKTLMTQIATMV